MGESVLTSDLERGTLDAACTARNSRFVACKAASGDFRSERYQAVCSTSPRGYVAAARAGEIQLRRLFGYDDRYLHGDQRGSLLLQEAGRMDVAAELEARSCDDLDREFRRPVLLHDDLPVGRRAIHELSLRQRIVQRHDSKRLDHVACWRQHGRLRARRVRRTYARIVDWLGLAGLRRTQRLRDSSSRNACI